MLNLIHCLTPHSAAGSLLLNTLNRLAATGAPPTGAGVFYYVIRHLEVTLPDGSCWLGLTHEGLAPNFLTNGAPSPSLSL